MTGTISRTFYIGEEVKKGFFASVYNYRPHNEEILARKGEVFAVLRLKTGPDFDLVTTGGLLLDYFHETYFEMQESSALLALEKTVISSGKHLAKLIDKDDKVGKVGIEMELLVGSIVNDTAFFVTVGNSRLYIFRNEDLVDLGTALKDPTGEGLVRVASMKLEPDDRLLITTKASLDSVSEFQIGRIMKKFDLDEYPKERSQDYESALMLVGYSIEHGETEIDEVVSVEEELKVVEKDSDLLMTESLDNTTYKSEKGDDLEEKEEERSLGMDSVVEEKQLDEQDDLRVRSSSLSSLEEEEKDIVEEDTEKSLTPKTYQIFLSNIKNKILALPSQIKLKRHENLNKEDEGESEHNTFSRRQNQAGAKNKFIILGITFVLCVGGLYLGIRQAVKNNAEKVQEEEVQVSLDALKQKVLEIEGLVSDIKISDSTEKRQQGLSEVELARKEIDKVKDYEKTKEEVNGYVKQVDLAEDFFNRVISISKDNRLIDVASYFPDAEISDIASSSNRLYLTDSKLGKIYSMDFSGSDIQEVVTGLNNPMSLTIDDKGNLIFLDESEENKIAIYNIEKKETKRLVGTSKARIGDVVDIDFSEISGGRLYLLDKENKKVLFMERTGGNNYGLPSSRFSMDELSTGKDIQIIDGKIYVLLGYKQGIYRYLSGQDDTPELTGLPEGTDMKSATGMFIDGTDIYISDSSENRIAIFDKGIQTAKFKGQYKSKDKDILSGLKDLTVVSSEGKIYTIDRSSVYEFDLTKLNEL